MSGRGAIVIAGFGSSAIERKSERGITAFAHDSAIAALKDAGVSRDQIDGYIGAPWATNAGSVHAEGADEISVKTAAAAIGLRSLRFGMDLFRRYAPDMVAAAALALKSGACRYVLGLRALYNVQGRASSTVNGSRAYGYDQFTKPFGYTTAGARFAVRAQRYMARHGVDRTDLYEVVALARRNADRNPFAIWKGRALTRESYIEAPMIASPHGLYDCDMPVCGAAAFIMCRAEDLPSGATPAYVTGWSGFQTPEEVFAMSCLRPGDVTLCQFYDGFSSMVFDWLEAFGFCEEGTAWKLIRDGGAEVGGRLPLNTFGGSLGEGRLHGIGHLREAYLQVAGKADGRQVAKSGPCLVQVGPYDDSAFVMLQPEPARRIHATL